MNRLFKTSNAVVMNMSVKVMYDMYNGFELFGL